MEFIWEAPQDGFVKINVHYVSVEDPLPNGNTNNVAALITNAKGKKLWGLLAQCQTVQRSKQSSRLSRHLASRLSSRNWTYRTLKQLTPQVYETIRLQEEIILDENQDDYYGMFSTIQQTTSRWVLQKERFHVFDIT